MLTNSGPSQANYIDKSTDKVSSKFLQEEYTYENLSADQMNQFDHFFSIFFS